MHALNIEVTVVYLSYLSLSLNAHHLFVARDVLHLDQHLQEAVVTGQNGPLILGVDCSLILKLDHIHKRINLNIAMECFKALKKPILQTCYSCEQSYLAINSVQLEEDLLERDLHVLQLGRVLLGEKGGDKRDDSAEDTKDAAELGRNVLKKGRIVRTCELASGFLAEGEFQIYFKRVKILITMV